MKTRIFDPATYLALKAATQRACQKAGTLSEISALTRLDAGTISKAGNFESTSFLPLDVVLDVDAMNDFPVILASLADLLGYKIVQKELLKTGDQDVTAHISDIAQASGSLIGTLGKSLADKVFSKRDAIDTLKIAADAKDEISELEAFCAEKVAEAA